ncbi:TetR/AcrR family transcriptional regulator [Brevibacillus laterosporus]|uniref:TetR/AcrR family transcriptional regulator n=1 Tax=Brevibacillus laterosporus TaxID=1465 RepID=A0AAP3DGA3_BRELA|nr:TetR/AcrR family transcriptional regulator [Brevibacillus laterosporus]MCR8980754.1 TetR/AcrR family transcriptional regulator [Brevibacillus laterosporus]MCZ0807909.1 TetR/AcrR family transcriptional regulator [Brevibacillus laterosporus]MCZ0826200.1 TetR/AcrR family transcriptional regulator [Brevibacillus laterosporus]MCZ0851211.1 TetR/AcrR family transcriptional regulator [Brevibacillus laterosporus]PPA93297.1 TetR/AcrR family transcriptional regulator [Brevibacillus laterosporus]
MEEDVRVYKTKKSISEALIILLNEKDFSQITIKDICTRSLTSKSTFYSHFVDKYDLLEKIVKKHASSFKKEITLRFEFMDQGNVAEVIEMIIDQTSANKTEIATLLNVHVSLADLRVEFETILYNACFSYLEKELTTPTVSIDYLAQLYVANAMVLMNWTLKNDKDTSAIDLADKMQQYIFNHIHK